MENNYGIFLIWLLPILGGIAAFFSGKKNTNQRNDIVDIVMGGELLTLGYLCYPVLIKKAVVGLSLDGVFGFGLYFTIDGMRLFFCILATFVYGVVSQFMKDSMKYKHNSNRFYLFFMASYTMVLGAFMTTNMYNFIIFIVLAMLFLYPMIMHREDKVALKNAKIYLAFTIIGLVLLVTGLVLIYIVTGKVSYIGIYSDVLINGSNEILVLGGLIMMLGFAVFSGMFPMQFQITRGCSYGLMEASAIITSVISKFGLLGIMILSGCLFRGNALAGKILLVLALLTTVWGLNITFSVTDIRKILMGLNIVTNGFASLGVSLMILCGKSNGYAIRGSLYMMMVSSLSLLILYMAAMEQVCKVKTYEINGLIASGKENKMLAAICLLACVNLGGVPGTIGFLSHSMIYKTILTNISWKWLTVVYIILWAFLMTAVTRVFMKLFVSKKEETLRILTTKEEMKQDALSETEDAEQPAVKKNPYLAGEIVLLIVGVLQFVVGILSNLTVDKMAVFIRDFFKGEDIVDAIPYFTSDALVGFSIAAVLCVLLYVNLVHGILLRAIKNKKNKKLKEKISE